MMIRITRWRVTWLATLLLLAGSAQAQTPSGPTLDEPFHMPTMTDTSTLDVVIVEIRVPVRLIAPWVGSVNGFIISGALLPETGDTGLPAYKQAVIDGGVGVVQTKIKRIGHRSWILTQWPSMGVM